MKKTIFKTETLFYILILLVAVALRLGGLGRMPLNESEAQLALQAYQVSQGEAAVLGVQPAYVLLTGLLFTVFGSSDALARLLPALVGSLLVAVPFVLRHRLGRTAALLLAFGLAVDPGLVAVARQAGGPGLAIGFLALTVAAWMNGAPRWAGVLGAFALLSGPSFWLGILILFLAWAVHLFFYRERLDLPLEQLRQAGIVGGITLLLAGTLFLRYPQGLSALAGALPQFLAGWLAPTGAPALQIPLALAVYQPLALGLALVAYFRRPLVNRPQMAQPLQDFFKLWLAIGLAVLLVFPGRQVTDLVWLMIPLWGLAADVLADYLPIGADGRSGVSWSFGSLVFLFAGFSWLNLAAFSRLPAIPWDEFIMTLASGGWGGFSSLPPNTQFYVIRIVVMILMPLLTIVSTVMIALGWSKREAINGLVWGLVTFFGLWGLAATWGLAYLPERAANELWTTGRAAGHSAMILETIGDISEYELGTRTDLDLVYQVDSAAMAWALRDLSQARYTEQLALGELPSLLITGSNIDEPLLAAAYSGQSFPLSYSRDWGGPLPQNFASWLLHRSAPTTTEIVILWVRADLFPEGSLLPTANDQPAADDTAPEEDIIPERLVP